MKLLALLGTAAALLLAVAGPTESRRPPALLTFSIAYGPRGVATGGLCIARLDGSGRLRLTAKKDDRTPTWSPRGKYVAFARQFRTEPYFKILIADTRGRIVRKFGEAVFNTDPAWSPNGRQIAFIAGWRGSAVDVVNRDGRNERTVRAGGFETSFHSPSWSPDGRRLAYGMGSDRDSAARVYTIRVDGSDQRLVAENASDPDWSPDGTRLAYVDKSQGHSEIVIARPDGTDPRTVTSTPESESRPAWSPDGKLIAFDRTDEQLGRTWIVVVRSDTGRLVSVIRGPYNLYWPAWRPPTVLPTAKRLACDGPRVSLRMAG